MRYWWVNQNQTYKAEVGGGYVWSPKRNKNDRRNQFYENMREIAPGDLIFSFRDRTIAAYGFATSNCYEALSSTGRCNTRSKFLRWCLKCQGLSRALIQL